MSVSREDLELQRYVDGEMSPEAAAAFASRMLQDASLRARCEELQPLGGGFAAVREEPVAETSPNFVAGVLSQVRRLPDRAQLEQAEVAEGSIQLCRRLLMAALVLFAIGAAWRLGLLDGGRASTLEAGPADVQKALEQLDQRVLDGMKISQPARGK